RVQRATNPYVVQLIDDHRWFRATFEDNCKEYEERNGIIAPTSSWDEVRKKLVEEDIQRNKEEDSSSSSSSASETVEEPKVQEKSSLYLKPREVQWVAEE